MRPEQRVIAKLSGVDSDLSRYVNDYRVGSSVLAYAVGDYLYIGTILPMNHLYFDMKVPNTVTAKVSVEIWWAGAWQAAVDIDDNTNGLKANGKIFFNAQFNRSWDSEQECSRVTGLEAQEIYNMYWTRVSWDATLNPLTEINYIGQKFSDDTIMFSYFPDLAQPEMLEAFKAGKVSWDEQHFMASEFVVKDLLKRDILKSRTQILDPYDFKDAACFKAAEYIYFGMGKPYLEIMTGARDRYKEEMNMRFYKVDLNKNSRLDPIERVVSTRFLKR